MAAHFTWRREVLERSLLASAALMAALLSGSATHCAAGAPDSSGTVVELETPLDSPQALEGYLRRPAEVGPSPAVVLLHSCNGNWRRLDQRWGTRIAAWGYVTLAVDSFGPRGLHSTCTNGSPQEMAFDAYRALAFLAKQPYVDPARVAALGFSQGGWLALASVERGVVEQRSPYKFAAAIAFYPPCRAIKGNMTVPTLIMIGELDDWTPAQECRNLAEGEDTYGVSRQKDLGIPVKLLIYPGAHHAFDAPNLKMPIELLGHHLEYNESAAEQASIALHEFLESTIGKEPIK
jgi:dienelactone hydrolase